MRESQRPTVVVTGAGICTHMGDDLPGTLAALREGRATPFARWKPAVDAGARCQVIGTFPGEIPVDKQHGRFMGRAARLALHAARFALVGAGLERRDVAVVVGSGTGDVETHREVHEKLAESGARRISPTAIPKLMSSTVSANLATALRTTGPSFSATAACAGGAYNVLLAAELIANGHVEAAIAGGVEAADIHFHVGFDAMRAMNGLDNERPERASRPYAADRAGFIFSEGAGVVVLERLEHARARGARVLGELLGFGMSSDGVGEMVAPSATGQLAAMRRALEHAGLDPHDVDYVNTHGTSTPAGDVAEVRAIRELLGGRHVAYSSTKGYTGHTASAAGVLEAIFCWAMLRDGWIAPCVHAEPLDPELADYPPVLRPFDRRLSVALSNSFGFGGTNVTLALGPPPPAA